METQRMIRNLYTRLVLVVIITALAIWVDMVPEIQIRNPFNDAVLYERKIAPRLGLDLQGGLQVLLEADLPEERKPDAAEMETARTIASAYPTGAQTFAGATARRSAPPAPARRPGSRRWRSTRFDRSP